MMDTRDLSRAARGAPPGIPLAVKDLFDTAGLTTTYGSVIFADHVPTERRGRRPPRGAGYANVGKTNLHEFAYGVTSQNPHYGTVPNPLAPGRIAGGSSGGSAAALAAGLADAALGTDTGGSIRIPAACCGIVGFKPTFGLVPLDGCFPLAPSFDHAGPMARTVAECAAMMQPSSPGSSQSPHAMSPSASPGATAANPSSAPGPRGGGSARCPTGRLPASARHRHAFMREVADVHRALFAEHADPYGENVRTKIERCLAVTDAEAASADRREEYRGGGRRPRRLDLLLSRPCLRRPAAPGRRARAPRGADPLHVPVQRARLAGARAPRGPAEEGLPASVQLVGRPGDDALVLAARAALETVHSPV